MHMMTDLFAHAIRCGRFFAELTWKAGGPFFFGGLLVICWILSKLWKWSLLVACAVRVGSKRRGSVTDLVPKPGNSGDSKEASS